ncbi:MAG: response regulator [Alphaproteobacteria bacterium]|nr:response regulator [Alphaproteobacteria bacterium]MBU2379561.1 response regulator [Alphaproteobacteria bacterium]
MARPATPDRVNLARSTVLLVDHNPKSLDMLSSIFHGFGVKEQIKRDASAAAVEVVKARELDLILIDCSMPDMDGYDFIRWLRRETNAPVRYTPVIMLTGHAAQSKVHKSRDCGASFVVTKPLTPSVLLQRVLWLAGDEREFVECETYVGPDRRVRNFGPPVGMPGRRSGDLSEHVGAASEANMDQSEIDMLMKPMKVSI